MRQLLCCIGIAMLFTGCSGIELGGKAWLSRVDERQESQRTYRESIPWKCYFVACDTPSKEVEGS